MGCSMTPLTPRQYEVFKYIEGYIAGHGYAPSCADIGASFNITRKGAYCHILTLQKKGYIETTPKVARSIVILKQGSEET